MKLGFLRPLYEDYGDYVSVYLDVSRAAEDAAQAIELRWRAARERLAAEGADRATLDAVAAEVTDPANAALGIAIAFCQAGHQVPDGGDPPSGGVSRDEFTSAVRPRSTATRLTC